MSRYATLLLGPLLLGVSQPQPPSLDTSREIVAIRSYALSQRNRLWPGYGAAPFEMLLIDRSREILLCHAAAPPGFIRDGEGGAPGCSRFVRPRGNLPPTLLAAMPIFGLPATIVMGTPESTGLGRHRWRMTVLHEHFHQ